MPVVPFTTYFLPCLTDATFFHLHSHWPSLPCCSPPPICCRYVASDGITFTNLVHRLSCQMAQNRQCVSLHHTLPNIPRYCNKLKKPFHSSSSFPELYIIEIEMTTLQSTFKYILLSPNQSRYTTMVLHRAGTDSDYFQKRKFQKASIHKETSSIFNIKPGSTSRPRNHIDYRLAAFIS